MSGEGQLMVRWSGDIQVNVSKMLVNVKSQSELDIGGRETCNKLKVLPLFKKKRKDERQNQFYYFDHFCATNYKGQPHLLKEWPLSWLPF